ncbi:hypothetical protein TREMEDRAFT_18678, partial [Tremella mesenterica DSM 1558]|uniref:uncharacterized protein n=1 Tax=Tremella mesenterica (strain ATCC 24925 / CBS 8224 / DSM 1558 / NBRC 9311 / NRRL Y-6157 / RJB 2259-6 / UBC 559-6) TaxID=578456 RepID=UPI0003F495B7
DPNFPSNLSIKPLEIGSGRSDYQKQAEDIDRYGIAGRVWEGGSALLKYFTPDIAYDPPCSLLIGSSSNAPYRIVELGSGQSVPSLHLASILSPHDVLILTDLPDVVPLCEERVLEWEKSHANGPLMKVEALAWGGDVSRVRTSGPLSHILLCDLIYFPQLYPPLLRTLLELTEPSSPPEDDVFGPEIILSYFSRTLALEQAFFDALALYFQMTPV